MSKLKKILLLCGCCVCGSAISLAVGRPDGVITNGAGCVLDSIKTIID